MLQDHCTSLHTNEVQLVKLRPLGQLLGLKGRLCLGTSLDMLYGMLRQCSVLCVSDTLSLSAVGRPSPLQQPCRSLSGAAYIHMDLGAKTLFWTFKFLQKRSDMQSCNNDLRQGVSSLYACRSRQRRSCSLRCRPADAA